MEVEAKFSIPDRETFQRLLEVGSLAGLDLAEAEVTHHRDQYLDTPDGALRAQGYACRLRQVHEHGQHTLVTLKGLGQAAGAVHRREEIEVDLPGPLLPHDWPPGEARDLALRLADGRPLVPLLAIEQTRHTRALSRTLRVPPGPSGQAAGRTVAVLSLDEVSMCHDGQVQAVYLELEAELVPGAAETELRGLADVLEREWHLRPESRSKFERALALQAGSRLLTAEERAVVDRLAQQAEVVARRARLLQAWDNGLPRADIATWARLSPRRTRHWLGAFQRQRLGIFGRWLPPAAEPAEPAPLPPAPEVEPAASLPRRPGIAPDDRMGQAARKVLRLQAQRMVYHEPGTRLGEDAEALHDMRVATRRLRAALRVFAPYLEPAALRRLVRGARGTGRSLGPVRDLDVFGAKTVAYMESLPEAERGGLDEFLAVLVAQREAARARMLAYLDGKRYARFKKRLAAYVATDDEAGAPPFPAGREPLPERVRQVAPVAIYQRLAVVRAFDPEVNVPDPEPARLHALRIACKRLRYTLEFFEEVLGPGTRALIKEVVAVQDHLGALQDAVVAGDILADYLAHGTWGPDLAAGAPPRPPAPAPGVEAYLAAQRAEMDLLLATFSPSWQRIESRAFRRMVAEAVAAL